MNLSKMYGSLLRRYLLICETISLRECFHIERSFSCQTTVHTVVGTVAEMHVASYRLYICSTHCVIQRNVCVQRSQCRECDCETIFWSATTAVLHYNKPSLTCIAKQCGSKSSGGSNYSLPWLYGAQSHLCEVEEGRDPRIKEQKYDERSSVAHGRARFRGMCVILLT